MERGRVTLHQQILLLQTINDVATSSRIKFKISMHINGDNTLIEVKNLVNLLCKFLIVYFSQSLGIKWGIGTCIYEAHVGKMQSLLSITMI